MWGGRRSQKSHLVRQRLPTTQVHLQHHSIGCLTICKCGELTQDNLQHNVHDVHEQLMYICIMYMMYMMYMSCCRMIPHISVVDNACPPTPTQYH